eukprot:GHVN01013981.1.p1 GENE.GHVN01013981.1~~GHVN01013981.1.p1  ORF type:complete len:999 (+),score=95.52 GHVN01013981.1:2219-5215(+)
MESVKALAEMLYHKRRVLFCSRWKKSHVILYSQPPLICIHHKTQTDGLISKPVSHMALHGSIEIVRGEDTVDYSDEIAFPVDSASKSRCSRWAELLGCKAATVAQRILFGKRREAETQLFLVDGSKRLELSFGCEKKRMNWMEAISQIIEACRFRPEPTATDAETLSTHIETLAIPKSNSLDMGLGAFPLHRLQEDGVSLGDEFHKALEQGDYDASSRLIAAFEKLVIGTLVDAFETSFDILCKQPLDKGLLRLRLASDYFQRSSDEILRDEEQAFEQVQTARLLLSAEGRTLHPGLLCCVLYKGFVVIAEPRPCNPGSLVYSAQQNICDRNALSTLRRLATSLDIEQNTLAPLGNSIKVFSKNGRYIAANMVGVLPVKELQCGKTVFARPEMLLAKNCAGDFLARLETLSFFPKTSRMFEAELNRHGLSIEELGSLYECACLPHTRRLLVAEMLARAANFYLRPRLREICNQHEEIRAVCSCFQAFLSLSEETPFFSREICPAIRTCFGVDLEHKNAKQVHPQHLFTLLQENCGVVFNDTALHPETRLSPGDFVRFAPVLVPCTLLPDTQPKPTTLKSMAIEACGRLEQKIRFNAIELGCILQDLAADYLDDGNIADAEQTNSHALSCLSEKHFSFAFSSLLHTRIDILKDIRKATARLRPERMGDFCYKNSALETTFKNTVHAAKNVLEHCLGRAHPLLIAIYEEASLQHALLSDERGELQAIETALGAAIRYLGRSSPTALRLATKTARCHNKANARETAVHLLSATMQVATNALAHADTARSDALHLLVAEIHLETAFSLGPALEAATEAYKAALIYERLIGAEDARTRNALRIVFQALFLFLSPDCPKDIRTAAIKDIPVPSFDGFDNKGPLLAGSVRECIHLATDCLERLFVSAKSDALQKVCSDDLLYIIRAVVSMRLALCTPRQHQLIRSIRRKKIPLCEELVRLSLQLCLERGPSEFFSSVFEGTHDKIEEKVYFCLQACAGNEAFIFT